MYMYSMGIGDVDVYVCVYVCSAAHASDYQTLSTPIHVGISSSSSQQGREPTESKEPQVSQCLVFLKWPCVGTLRRFTSDSS